MTASKKKGTGATFRWLKGHLEYEGDDCLIWPFCRDPGNGYGRLGYNGKPYWAHRFMCELAHGESPTPKHEAAHSCGNGHEGCVNPRHLSWKTRAENQADRYIHNRKPKRAQRYKLTWPDVHAIRALGRTEKTKDLAARFGVSTGNIRQILIGQTWRH
jgi:hypothetical protein